MTLHIVQRGNNRSPTFFGPGDYTDYLNLLELAAHRHETHVHAYVLMTNHVHLLMTSDAPGGISCAMRYLGSRYTSLVNKRHGRTGTLWESRFRSFPVGSERYCLACYRYIELNPVRARMVRIPTEYRWSSYAANATGRESSIVTPHAAFLALGDTARQRAQRYRELVREAIAEDVLRDIRESVRSGLPFGPEALWTRVEASLQRPLGTGCRGRPRKTAL